MLELSTVNDILAGIANRGAQTIAMWKRVEGWKPIMGRTMYGRVRALAAAMESWGIRRGDRIAIISENRWEWPVVDFAAMALGGADFPLYQTLSPEQVAYMLRDSGSRVAFVSTLEQYDKVVKAGELPALERVVVFDEGNFPNATSLNSLLENAPNLESRDAAFDAKLAETK